jgi:hypothetical protein
MSETGSAGAFGNAAMANAIRFATRPLDIKATLQLSPENLLLLHEVLRLLGDAQVTTIAFSIPSVTVDSVTFSSVRHALMMGKVQAFVMGAGDPDSKISDGFYAPKANFLKVGNNKAWPRARLATIVHECVHAAHDIAGKPGLFVLDTEAAAYIAGAVWLRRQYPAATGRPGEFRPGDYVTDPVDKLAAAEAEAIYTAAWTCAVKIEAASAPSRFRAGDTELDELYKAIKASSLYAGSFGDKVVADGVD